jgi:hypothetical protein
MMCRDTISRSILLTAVLLASCDDGNGGAVDADQDAGDAGDVGPDADCVPDCEDRCCGSDGCGGECPDTCGDGGRCDRETCECIDLSACGVPDRHPECSSVSPAPEDTADIEAFIAGNAISLECLDGGEEAWDFSIFEADMEEMSIFMFGEVHGSRELGNISADLFEFLVRQGVVDSLAIEFAVDATDAMNEYIRTGEGDLVTVYRFDRYSPNDFLRLTLERARALHEEGFEIAAFAVDYPWDLQQINADIETLASDLTEEQRALVLDTMPAAPPGLSPHVGEGFVTDAKDYLQHIVDNLPTICAELTEEDCERLEMLARALWVGAFAASDLMSTASEREFIEFLTVREELIFFNYRAHMTSGEERVYAHMGEAHTLKGDSGLGFDSTAGRLDSEYPFTQGRVYTTVHDNGPGSEVNYWGDTEPVYPEYDVLATALEGARFDTYAVSTFQPGQGCVGNPLASLDVPTSPEVCGDAYDTIVFVRLLTPDDGAKSSRWEIGSEVQHALDCLESVREVEARLARGHDR